MLFRKIFENLHAEMAILVLFRIIFRQIVFKLFDSNSECFAKYDTGIFYFHTFNYQYACLRRKTHSYQRGSKL